jgi:hypothetical protein
MEILAMIIQVFVDKSMRLTQVFELKTQKSLRLIDTTGGEQSQGNGHNFLFIKGIVHNLFQQATQLIPHITVMFYLDGVKICKDFTPNNTPDSYSKWGMIRHGAPQGSIPGPLLLYINNLPKSLNDNAETVLFADYTSIIFTSSNLIKF